MTTIGIIGAGEVGSQLARAAVAKGYEIVIANSREPETLAPLVFELGPAARAATARDAAAAGDFVIIAVPLTLAGNMPVEELAGKVVVDTNNYMPGRDGHFAVIDSEELTVHELRQQQLPTSKVVKAFTHIQAPTLLRFARPPGAADRLALAVSSDYQEAVDLVTRFYDQLGFDTVDHSPLSQSWRSGPGTATWQRSLMGGQSREALSRSLSAATQARDA